MSRLRPPVVWCASVVLALCVPTIAPAGRWPVKPDEKEFVQDPKPAAVQVLPWSEGFESGANGWSMNGKWHVRQNPQTTRVSAFIRDHALVNLPDDGSWPAAWEGSSVLVYSDDAPGTPEEGTYVAPWLPASQYAGNGGSSNQANQGEAVSPPIDLTGATSARLELRTWYEIESVDPAPDQFDAMLVGVSADGGAFAPVGHSGPAVDYNGRPYEPATSGGFNLPGQWVQQVFDLSPWAGHVVRLRFRFQTMDNMYNGFRGWFLDDLRVFASATAPCDVHSVTPPCTRSSLIVQVAGENFVNGSVAWIGGVPAAQQSVLSSTVMEVQVPPLDDGTYGVRIVRPDGTACERANALTVDYANCPTTCSVSSLSPPCSSPGTGATYDVTIEGANFQASSVVYLGTNACATNVTSPTQVRFRVPVIPDGTYPVKVVSPTGLECAWGGPFLVDRSHCPTPVQRSSWGSIKARYR